MTQVADNSEAVDLFHELILIDGRPVSPISNREWCEEHGEDYQLNADDDELDEDE